MTGLRAKAIAAFEEDAERKEATAAAYFKKDFGVDPDEVAYQCKHQFLFRANGLHIMGTIELMGDYLYCKYYQLVALCREPRCGRLVVDEKSFFQDLAGLGEAINEHWDLGCDLCARASAG